MESLDDIISKFPSFEKLVEDQGAFGKAKKNYEAAITMHREYETDVQRDLQRAVNKCREKSSLSQELRGIDRHYSPKIVSRVKSLDSIYRKIVRGEIKWEELPLDDTAGYRLVCRFIDEAIEIRGLLDEELNKPPFAITSKFPKNDSGSWAEKEVNSGYRSYDFAFIYSRPELEIKLEGELQVRTILQHAWAEVSHDTIYKNDLLSIAPKDYSEPLVQGMNSYSDMLSAIDWGFVQLRKLAVTRMRSESKQESNKK